MELEDIFKKIRPGRQTNFFSLKLSFPNYNTISTILFSKIIDNGSFLLFSAFPVLSKRFL